MIGTPRSGFRHTPLLNRGVFWFLVLCFSNVISYIYYTIQGGGSMLYLPHKFLPLSVTVVCAELGLGQWGSRLSNKLATQETCLIGSRVNPLWGGGMHAGVSAPSEGSTLGVTYKEVTTILRAMTPMTAASTFISGRRAVARSAFVRLCVCSLRVYTVCVCVCVCTCVCVYVYV